MMISIRSIFFGALLLFVYSFFFPIHVEAKKIEYNKQKLMTNHALTTVALPPRGIQAFLEERGSVLATHTVKYKGEKIPASTYIYKVSKKFGINPEVILTLAAKESSATEISRWTDAAKLWTLGYAVCDSCTFEDAAEFRGFKKQIYYGTQQFRLYLTTIEEENRTIAGWGVGVPKRTFDNIKITPKNAATAAHYSYTPWVGVYDGGATCCGGNSLFQRLWQIYDFDTQGKIRVPRGTVLKVDGAEDLYVIKNNRVRKVSEEVAKTDYAMQPRASISEAVFLDQYLRFYKKGNTLRFPTGTVVRNTKTQKVYLIVNNKKHLFTAKGLAAYDYDEENVVDATPSQLNVMRGPNITPETAYPTGAFLKDSSTENVYYYNPFTQKKHLLPHKKIISQRRGDKKIHTLTHEEITVFDEGESLLLPDGTLVRSKNKKKYPFIYVAEKDVLTPFSSKKTIKKHGLRKKDALTVSDELFELYTVSDTKIDTKKKAATAY